MTVNKNNRVSHISLLSQLFHYVITKVHRERFQTVGIFQEGDALHVGEFTLKTTMEKVLLVLTVCLKITE